MQFSDSLGIGFCRLLLLAVAVGEIAFVSEVQRQIPLRDIMPGKIMRILITDAAPQRLRALLMAVLDGGGYLVSKPRAHIRRRAAICLVCGVGFRRGGKQNGCV